MFGDQLYPILINLVAAFLGALGQYCYKLGGIKLKTAPIQENWELLVGLILFTGVMPLLILGFKLGGRISVTYPVYSLTFVIGTGLGIYFGKEAWNIPQLAGVLMVVTGIIVVAAFAPNS